ncbi:MAG: NYN domain-containing protein [Bacteroidetes bacterium]|nr:NYN domain-containing protein [Bacteroidota bacterium]
MEKLKIAVLIDGDNANPKIIEDTLSQIQNHGQLAIKRVYGDWSQPQLGCWKVIVNKHSIKTMQTFNYTKGKNSTDIALIIDAMDLLYSGKVNAFCIVSSDCDFTGLIHRIKENNLFTIGVGKVHSCSSFKNACDLFLFEENSMKKIELKKEINYIDPKEIIFKVKTNPLPGLKILGKIDPSVLKN